MLGFKPMIKINGLDCESSKCSPLDQKASPNNLFLRQFNLIFQTIGLIVGPTPVFSSREHSNPTSRTIHRSNNPSTSIHESNNPTTIHQHHHQSIRQQRRGRTHIFYLLSNNCVFGIQTQTWQNSIIFLVHN